MKNIMQNLIRNKKGVTLMEIMTALLIMAFAFLPIIGVIGTSTKDTDMANSDVFAQTTARNILDTLLDDVPFNSIRQGTGNIAILENYGNNYDISNFKQMIGIKNDSSSAIGTVRDEDRGVDYNITIYVFPISATKSNDDENRDVSNEMLFTYLPRPQYEDNDNWYTYDSTDDDDAFIKIPLENVYKYEESKKEIKNAYQLGARPNNNISEYYVMKKILFKMDWTGKDGKERSLKLYTMKANLDSDGKQITTETE